MKIVVGIATTGTRQRQLKHTLESLNDQTLKPDHIHVYDNSKEEVDYTDNGKFYFLQFYDEPIYYLSCDDDILYPEDYVEKIVSQVDYRGCIVTYHGRILKGQGRNYYREHSACSCTKSFVQTHKLDVAGTGVTAFRTDYFNPVDIYKAEDKCMSDLVFSLEATKQGKEIIHLGHKGNWIIGQIVDDGIYDRFNQDCTRQNEIADEIWLLKN